MRQGLFKSLSWVVFLVSVSFAAGSAQAAESVRWTGAEDKNATLAHVVAKINAATGLALTQADFHIGEDRDLAFNHYRRYDQIIANVDIKDMAIRVWTDKRTHQLIQLEARVEAPTAQPVGVIEFEAVTGDVREAAALGIVRDVLRDESDRQLRGLDVRQYWHEGRLVLAVTAKARRGAHVVAVDALTLDVLTKTYKPYPNADTKHPDPRTELSVPARVYPIYEEYKGQLLERQNVTLKYIQRQAARPDSDPFTSLGDRQYFYRMHDRVRGETADGQAQGYWSMSWLRRQITTLQRGIPKVPNDFAHGGVLLSGRYATINIYPEAFTAFPGVTIPKAYSSQAMYSWLEDTANDDWQIVPGAAALGQVLTNPRSAIVRDATRDPQHNPATYINNGFDEVQVYYAINQMFDALRPMGFVDPDLGERPFHAFLFDPSIESQDNAYYTDDTINFTTYTPAAQNYARDNTTIWHELGHGVMDRLMGERLTLADTGGLSEGMADFVSEMVLQATTGGIDFPGINDQRIINETGFFLTNEVHDDGEAYGGVMKDILDAALARDGRAGLPKVVDLVLEAMRLTRDHPELTAEVWFDRMKFADTLGRPGVRRQGELTPLIDAALASRNFASEEDRGGLVFKYQGADVVADAPGSRDHEIELNLTPTDFSEHQLHVELLDGALFAYEYPVEVRVFFNSGPLQGAIDWVGEDTEPQVHVLNAPGEVLTLNVAVRGACDAVNRSDGSCSDFAYVQVFNRGAERPVAKKRFYLRIHPAAE